MPKLHIWDSSEHMVNKGAPHRQCPCWHTKTALAALRKTLTLGHATKLHGRHGACSWKMAPHLALHGRRNVMPRADESAPANSSRQNNWQGPQYAVKQNTHETRIMRSSSSKQRQAACSHLPWLNGSAFRRRQSSKSGSSDDRG